MTRWLCFALALTAVLGLLLPAQATSAEAVTPAQAVSPAPVFAGQEQPLSASTAITGTPPMTGTIRIATVLAQYFDRNVQEILGLHNQDLGFGCITKALFIAAEAGVSLDQILAMRQQDLGWGEIRQSLGLPAGMPHTSLGQLISKSHGQKGPDWVPPGQAKKLGQSPGKGPKGADTND